METAEPGLNKRPRGWLAAGGRGGGRRRRGGQRVGGARGSSGRRLEGGGGRPRPQAPPRLRGSPACRRMDGACPGGGGCSEGGGGGGGSGYGVVARFSQCLAELRTWLRTNWLRFNADKTDVMLVGRGHTWRLREGKSKLP